MKSHKFVNFKLNVLTSHNNQKVSCSTTVLDLHSHLLWMRFTIQFSGCLVILDWSPCSDLAPLLLHILRTAHCTPLLYEISSSGVSMCGIYIGSLDPNMDTVAVKWDRTLDRDTREHLFNSFLHRWWFFPATAPSSANCILALILETNSMVTSTTTFGF